ncbi:MAG: hypothetical protein WC732_06090 [Candidatus Omnitrophota bacterium]
MDTQIRQQITDALETLNSAAQENKEEIKQIVREKFGQVKDILGAQKGMLQEKVAEGREVVTEQLTRIDSSVRSNPWPFLATAAASSFVLGVLFTNNKKKS